MLKLLIADVAAVLFGSDGASASSSCPVSSSSESVLRPLSSCLAGGSEGFAQRTLVKDPGCREPETGTDETDCIARGESRRAHLFDQWQAHGPERLVGEEDDDECRERKDEVAEEG